MILEELVNLKQKSPRYVAGLMSGTSLDGVDAALVELEGSGQNTFFRLLGFITYPFPAGLKEKLLENSYLYSGNVTNVCMLNFLIANIYADAVKALCEKCNLPVNKIDLIGSHGQTIHHLPEKREYFGYSISSTLQIGDPSVLAKLLNIPVIGDFRVGDVALGGQGAPLVPYFDYLMFSSPDKNIGLLNIGGISNITILKAGGSGADVQAFDTGPGNMMIDLLMKEYYSKEYDEDGSTALKGEVNKRLLRDLISNDLYLQAFPPKSTGREYYSESFYRDILLKYDDLPREDVIATITEYTVFCITFSYEKFINMNFKLDELIISGGGAKNKYIFEGLKKHFGSYCTVKILDDERFSADSKEAVCFAILANETLCGNTNNLPSVTGAVKDTILGKICLP